MFYSTEGLVTAAKRSDHFPVGQITFVDPDDLIAFANEEQDKRIVPFIMSVRQDNFLTFQTVPLVNNLSRYSLPERAIGNALKDLFYVPDVTNPQVRYPIPKADVHDTQGRSSSGFAPALFRIEGDEVVITPTPSNPNPNAALMFFYFMRPNQLVPTSYCAKITAVTSNSTQTVLTVDTDLTLSSLPQAIGSLADLLAGRSPFRLRAYDAPIQAITSTQITFNNADIQNEASQITIRVGDYVCPAQMTCIPMIFQELHPTLAEMIVMRACKAQTATANLQMSQADIKESLTNALHLISNRVEGEVDTIFDPNSILSCVR